VRCWYCLTRVTVLVFSLTATRMARPGRTVGGPPPSSNIVKVPPGCTSTSCWNTVLAPEPRLNWFWLVPIVHITAPVWLLTL
jgi:hypothetical protein